MCNEDGPRVYGSRLTCSQLLGVFWEAPRGPRPRAPYENPGIFRRLKTSTKAGGSSAQGTVDYSLMLRGVMICDVKLIM